jgi:hypothetical protein
VELISLETDMKNIFTAKSHEKGRDAHSSQLTVWEIL